MKKTQKTYILGIVSGIVAVFAFTIFVPTSAHAQMYSNYGYGSAGNSYGYGGGYGSYGGYNGGYGSYGGYGGYNGGYSNGYNGGYNNGGYNNGGYGGYGGYGDHGGYNNGSGYGYTIPSPVYHYSNRYQYPPIVLPVYRYAYGYR